MRVLLIQPPFSPEYNLPPLAIGALASAVQMAGHEVKILDLNLHFEVGMSVESSVSKCAKYGADVVGLTCWGNMSPFVIEFCRRFKSIRPEVKLVIGGEYATFRSEDILRESKADFVVRGEGEQTFSRLLSTLEQGGKTDKIEGITYREVDKIVSQPGNPSFMDMDKLPLINWNLFDDLKKYSGYGRFGHLPIQASRGCSFDCIFCSVQRTWGGFQRRKTPRRLIAEIKQMIKAFDITWLDFCDDTFTLNKEWITKICSLMLKEKIRVRWKVITRIDLVQEKLLSLMKRAGCVEVFYGIESICPRIQRFIGAKTYGEDSVKKNIAKTIAAGIEPVVSVIFGWPVDTPETVNHMSHFCQEIVARGVSRVHTHMLFPLPGTRLTKEYSSAIVPNPYPKVTQPDLGKLPSEFYSLLELHKDYVPDFWMFRSKSIDPVELVKLYAETKLSIIEENIYRRALM